MAAIQTWTTAGPAKLTQARAARGPPVAPPYWPRLILHVDMDAFFASVEQRDDPSLRGRPVIVGADPEGGRGRGVVAACSYEARAFGIHSAMPISRAWRLCPQGVYVRGRRRAYGEASRAVMSVLLRFADRIEQHSIDEACLDATGALERYPSAEALCRHLRASVRKETGLSCSVGAATNPTVAKIASGTRKPFGIAVVSSGGEEDFMSQRPAAVIPGVGPKTQRALAEMGVSTCAELARIPPETLGARFGKWGPVLRERALGRNDRPVGLRHELKSFGGETTFRRDTSDPAQIQRTLEELAGEVEEEAVRKRRGFRTLTLKVRLEDFTTHTRSRTLPGAVASRDVARRVARELVAEFLRGGRKVRLLGLRASGLVPLRALQATLEHGAWACVGEGNAVVAPLPA